MKIRTQIILWFGGLLAMVVLVTGATLYMSERRALERKVAETCRSLSDQFAQSCRDALLIHDELAAMNAAAVLGRSPGVASVYCVNEEGFYFAHTGLHLVRQRAGPPAGHPNDRWTFETDLSGGKGQARAGVVFSPETLASQMRADLEPAGRRIGQVSLIGFALGILGAVVLARAMTRPIQRIAEGTRAIAEGRLEHRIDLGRQDELGALAGDFNAMAGRLGELDRMKEEFVSNVSHELRSPLSAIDSYVNMVADDVRVGKTEKMLDHLAVVRNNTARLEKFINNLLDVSKIEANRVDIQKRRLLAREIFQEVVSLFSAKAFEKSIVLTGKADPGDLTVTADPDRLLQILTNLIGNALKFTPRGGRVTLSAHGGLPASVQPDLRPGSTYTCLNVEDTGPGIPPGDRERVFNRFEQAHRGLRIGVPPPTGTGLGLTIAQGIAEAHGGRLVLDQPDHEGCVFRLYLPESL